MRYIGLLLVLMLAVFLAGCATKPEVRIQTVEVKVPVMVPVPPPPVTPRPALVIFDLTEKDKQEPGKVALAYQATIKQLQGYAIQLETVIEGYSTLSKGQNSEGK